MFFYKKNKQKIIAIIEVLFNNTWDGRIEIVKCRFVRKTCVENKNQFKKIQSKVIRKSENLIKSFMQTNDKFYVRNVEKIGKSKQNIVEKNKVREVNIDNFKMRKERRKNDNLKKKWQKKIKRFEKLENEIFDNKKSKTMNEIIQY